MTLTALTIWQPWASLIAVGAKPHEFRSWPAPRRLWGQRIAIHAGARPSRRDEIRELLVRLDGPDAWTTGLVSDLARPVLERALMAPASMWRSCIVCTAVLGQPLRDADLAAVMGRKRINDSDRDEHSNWGWPLTAIERLEPPVPARGAQGLWPWANIREEALSEVPK